MTLLKLHESTPRTEDPRLLSGGGRYTDDLSVQGMVFAVMVRSEHAHANILSVETQEAEALEGVLRVLTAKDVAEAGFGTMPISTAPKTRPDGAPMYRPDYPVLCETRARHLGDPIAMVIAETADIAEAAAELVLVDYDGLPSVTDVARAVQEDAPRVWEDCPRNIAFRHEEGDAAAVEAAMAAAHTVVRQRFVISRAIAAALEPRAALGEYDPRTGRYRLHTPMQRGTNYRHELASVMQLPEAAIQVVAGDIGGSFGMKAAVYNEAPLVLLAAKLTGRPVKWRATRSESFLSDTHGRDNVTEAELALDAEGRFTALRVRTTGNLGAYSQPSSDIGLWGNIGGLAGVYTTPAIHVEATGCYTNTNPIRPYRGNGRPEASYVIERLVDLAADETGIDPAELRRRNMIPESAMPYKTPLAFTYDCGAFERVMDAALSKADYAGFPARREEAAARGRLRGIGLSTTIERAAAPGSDMAELKVDLSGGVTLVAGAVGQGQGHETVFKQIVSDRLGVPAEGITYAQGDTDTISLSEGSWGSRTSAIGASAVAEATDRLFGKARAIAAHVLGVPLDEVALEDGLFTARSVNRKLSLADLARAAMTPAGLPGGMDAGLSVQAGVTVRQSNFPNGAQVVEVEIDPMSGDIQIERVTIADDVGTVLNPTIVKGQLLGGFAQGAGQYLMERIVYDEDSGQLTTGSFMDYAMPRAAMMPHVDIVSVPVPTATNPLGAKGAGEGGCVGALPAVANAVVDALSSAGIRHLDMPATPERVWRALQAAQES
ncbi:xanthine dehydrogenase family protein molybdopterin-binding subunit [Arenibacterium sp. LLYu02]|uniref:xanthine dehydrogenase family protein molybdopterin-binding subunit n=1 Tax=Arenibacterium sp. LLYu02 TaxID=3404132 RepID=UPI003B2131BF